MKTTDLNFRRSLWSVALMAVVAIVFLVGQADAGLVYLHDFDDLTDVVVTADHGASAVISSDMAVDGSNSLKITDVAGGTADVMITPQIGGVNNTDSTITTIVRFYISSTGGTVTHDHANWRLRSGGSQQSYLLRGGPSLPDDHLAVQVGEWQDTGFAYPLDQWVTLAVAWDGGTGQQEVYADAGTNTSTLRGTYSAPTSTIDQWRIWPHYSGLGTTMYIDKLEIYSELGEGIVVPEPSAVVLLVMGGPCAVGLYWRRRK
ncbi:MAG: PEP-CTERM sorting domain-containing protein [Planctomycetota bacterium]|nr:PEP-CTERM sorting domain-containing protein [Planctomycetota bacterium]